MDFYIKLRMLWCTCTITTFHPSSMLPFPALGYSLPLLYPGVTNKVMLGYFYLGISFLFSASLQK